MPIVPRQNDVLFGKGTAINSHPGNRNFRAIVAEQKPFFKAALERKIKRRIAKDIINKIHSSGGRFLVEDTNANGTNSNEENEPELPDSVHPRILAKVWVSVEYDKVLVKVLHRLREKDKVGGQQKAAKENTEQKVSEVLAPKNKKEACAVVSSSQKIQEDSSISEDFEEQHVGKPEVLKSNMLDICENIGNSFDRGETNASQSNLQAYSPQSNLHIGDLGEDLTSFLREISVNDVLDQLETCQEGTLHDWIQRSKANHTTHVDYSKSGVPVALKLTECLVEADKDELKGEQNPIPLASINAANVLVRADAGGLNRGVSDNGNGPQEVIDLASIMSFVGDDPSAGDSMSRMAALGLILYELFAGEEPKPEDVACAKTAISLKSISLNNEVNCNQRPKKKSQGVQGGDICSKCVARLKYLGTPNTLCSLVGNLLDLTNGETCSDEAYSSLIDVLYDLQLMLDDPTRFLDDIIVSPMPTLTVPDKLYGREGEMQQLEDLYEQHMNGNCFGVIITGRAGVGKSKLAMHVEKLSRKTNSYFLSTKFDQNQTMPLAAIGSLFDTLVSFFLRDSTEGQRKKVGESLQRALGIQAALLVGILPSLSKLLPSVVQIEHSNCFDTSMSMSFLFDELLRELSSYSSGITFYFDDLHFVDPVSLLLIGSLIQSKSKSVFFICTYRDEDVSQNEGFNQWLRSSSAQRFETIKLDNMTEDDVNHLISDTLHLSPRITRLLSLVLHQKAGGGNALFLRQLVDSLKEKGYIHVDLSYPKWSWELDKIMNLAISGDVASLLIYEMQKLDDESQLCLKVASCIGSSAKLLILDILSDDAGQNLREALQLLSKKGFITVDDTMFSFCHAKIHQAAYELMTEHERCENHMRFGLAICSHTLNSNSDNNELFFTSINQMNLAGPNALMDHSQRTMVAALNLKAGKRSVDLSDLYTSFKLFKHGISFLGHDHWNTDYDLTLNLYEAASDAATFLNNVEAVTFYTQQVFVRAKCSDDKLNCMYAATKSLSYVSNIESRQSIYAILNELDEKLPRPLGDESLTTDMINMNVIIESMEDEEILSTAKSDQKKINILMKLYNLLCHLVNLTQPSLIGATSLRMIQLTMKYGLSSSTPNAFAHYGGVLVMLGNYHLAVRMGKLALKLADKKDLTMFRYKAAVFVAVYQSILWISTPFQAVADAHMVGHHVGQLSGEFITANLNLYCSLAAKYVAGYTLSDLREACYKVASKMRGQKVMFIFELASLLYIQQCALIEGLQVLDLERFDDHLPGIKHILANAKQDGKMGILLVSRIHWLVRTYLFGKFNDPMVKDKMSDMLFEKKMQPRLLTFFGIFFEGMISFQLARQSNDQDASIWIAKGKSVLKRMQLWNEHCPWNFEDKMLLLMASLHASSRETDLAESLYMRSIRSARESRFIHIEAIASEAAGVFYYEQGNHAKSLSLFLHSIECFKKWGASAVAVRVQADVQNMFGSDLLTPVPIDDMLASLIASEERHSKRRVDDGAS